MLPRSAEIMLKVGTGEDYVDTFLEVYGFYPESEPTGFDSSGRRLWATNYGGIRQNNRNEDRRRKRARRYMSMVKDVLQEIKDEEDDRQHKTE